MPFSPTYITGPAQDMFDAQGQVNRSIHLETGGTSGVSHRPYGPYGGGDVVTMTGGPVFEACLQAVLTENGVPFTVSDVDPTGGNIDRYLRQPRYLQLTGSPKDIYLLLGWLGSIKPLPVQAESLSHGPEQTVIFDGAYNAILHSLLAKMKKAVIKVVGLNQLPAEIPA